MADSNISIHSPWACNICFEELRDPVCTTCGHLFCWPCLYTWIQDTGTADKSCPVCRSRRLNSNASIIPVYVTMPGEPSKPPAAAAPAAATAAPSIPPRPLPPRGVPTTWAVLQACRENQRRLWRQEAMRHARRAGRPEEGIAELQRLVDVEARGLATLRRELNVHRRRNFYAVDTVMSGSQASTRNARTSSADRTNLDHQNYDADYLRRVFATVSGRPSL